MKTGILSLGAVALCQLAAAQPHAPLKHLHLHHARDQVAARDVVTVTEPVAKVQEVVVYMDANGKVVSSVTKIVDAPASTPSPKSVKPAPAAASASASAAAAAPAAKVQVQQHHKPSTSSYSAAPVPTTTSSAAPSSTSSSAAAPSGGWGRGLSYAPYTPSGDCKDWDPVKQDVAAFGDFDLLRIYGTDCSQVEKVLSAISGSGKKLFSGIYDVNNWQAEADIIINAVKKYGSWDDIHTLSVGNEVVNNGGSVSAVTGAVNAARTYFKNAGFTGPVVTVDTMMALDANPALYEASDYVAVNCHAFFDGNTAASGAGQFVADWVQKLGAKSGKTVAVTETGWPFNGDTHGLAVPGTSEQTTALSSLQTALSNNWIQYSACNNPWLKNNAGTYGAEAYWGTINGGNCPGS